MSFSVVKLGEVCEIKRGTTITQKDTIEGNVPVVAGGIKPTYYHNSPNRTGKTITISGSGANAGYVNFWDVPIFASDCSTVQVNRENLSINYVHYFLLSKQDYIYKELRSGAAQPHVYGKDISNIEINLPSLATQQKIVEKLDSIFAYIDKALEAAQFNSINAEILLQSHLKKVFEDGGKDWELLTIKDLIKIRSGDFLPAKNMNNEGSINVYGGNGISGKHNLHNASGENIIIGRVGAKCGNVRFVSGNIWVTDNAFYVSDYKININKQFLTLALELCDLRKFAKQTAQPVISFTTIKDASLKIPKSLDKKEEVLKKKKIL